MQIVAIISTFISGVFAVTAASYLTAGFVQTCDVLVDTTDSTCSDSANNLDNAYDKLVASSVSELHFDDIYTMNCSNTCPMQFHTLYRSASGWKFAF